MPIAFFNFPSVAIWDILQGTPKGYSVKWMCLRTHKKRRLYMTSAPLILADGAFLSVATLFGQVESAPKLDADDGKQTGLHQ